MYFILFQKILCRPKIPSFQFEFQVRVAKKSGAIIPRPEILKERKRPKSVSTTVSDTDDADLVWETTYAPIPESELIRVREY